MFKNLIITINPIIIAVFFDKIDQTIFNHLFVIRFVEDGLFNLLLIYFNIVKTNIMPKSYNLT